MACAVIWPTSPMGIARPAALAGGRHDPEAGRLRALGSARRYVCSISLTLVEGFAGAFPAMATIHRFGSSIVLRLGVPVPLPSRESLWIQTGTVLPWIILAVLPAFQLEAEMFGRQTPAIAMQGWTP
jgi:hypothetical protein